jgi:opacity protein-like surface antigen
MMRSTIVLYGVLVAAGWCGTFSRAGEIIPPIDLANFAPLESPATDSGSLPVENVAFESAAASRRFYLTGIIGASFATLTTGGAVDLDGDVYPTTGSINRTLFTAGGAAGMAFDRENGMVRAEFEGRSRDLMQGQTNLYNPDGSFFDNPGVRASNGWSTMANVWRDFDVTDRTGLYAGGGIGAGGYQLTAVYPPPPTAASDITQFAWQAGGGVTYAFTERLTLDLGYRFFAIGTGSSPVTAPANGFGQFGGAMTSSFAASELLLSVRLYEPFRNWR